jgi:hypothetical protein
MVDRETEMRQKKKAKEKETRNRGRKRFIWNSLSGAKTERDAFSPELGPARWGFYITSGTVVLF